MHRIGGLFYASAQKVCERYGFLFGTHHQTVQQ